MSTDLAFNHNQAIKNGAEINTELVPVYDEEDGMTQTGSYSQHWFRCPDQKYAAQCYVSGDKIHVRANPWGQNYAPITEWLTKNKIKWSEY